MIVANKTIDEVKIRKEVCIILKLDFEKVYNSVKWDFLIYMMGRVCFYSKWIKGCLESSYILFLVNGSPIEEFRLEKGLRQGDLLVLFLFLIVAEGLVGGLLGK